MKRLRCAFRSRLLVAACAALLAGWTRHAVGDPPEPPPLPDATTRVLTRIDGKQIVHTAKALCSKEYRGRAAGSPGIRRAAVLIAGRFRDAGLLPGGNADSYYQAFKIRLGYALTGSVHLQATGEEPLELDRATDYMPVHLPEGRAVVSAECVLAGYGITAEALRFDEYENLPVQGRAVVVFSGAPWTRDASRWLGRNGEDAAYGTLAYKVRNAAAHGAACVLVVDNPAGWRKAIGAGERLRSLDLESPTPSPIPVLQITRATATRLVGITADELRALALDIALDRDAQSMPLRGKTIDVRLSASGRARIGRNVVGVLPGSDETLRREAIVIGAHYDHLGVDDDTIFFGANDNAAGVGAMLAIAEAFAAMRTAPRRSIVFVAFDAEEIGKLGSRSYVARPTVPMERTALMINFDMIGRNAPDGVFAVGTRSSPELHAIHQDCNRHVGLTLDHPQSYRLGLSDHTPFFYAGTPIMYLFGGRDPDYNTPRDTWDKLIPEKVEKVARLAFLTALTVADRSERISFSSENP